MSETLAEAPEEVVEPVEVEASTEETVETPATPEPTVDVRELQAELEHLRDEHSQLVQWARQQGATPAQADAHATAQTGFDPASLVDEYGNIDPAAFLQVLTASQQQTLAAIDQRFAALAQPIYASQEAATIAEGEQQMRDVIADDFARNGDLPFGGDEVVSKIIDDVRNRYFPEASQKYGNTNRAAEIALSRAVAAERGYQKQIAEAVVTAHVNRNATLAGVRSEVAPGVSGVITPSDEILPPGGMARKYAANANRLRNT